MWYILSFYGNIGTSKHFNAIIQTTTLSVIQQTRKKINCQFNKGVASNL